MKMPGTILRLRSTEMKRELYPSPCGLHCGTGLDEEIWGLHGRSLEHMIDSYSKLTDAASCFPRDCTSSH